MPAENIARVLKRSYRILLYPRQCAKIASVFGVVVKIDDNAEETKKGISTAIRVLNPAGIVSNDFNVPSVFSGWNNAFTCHPHLRGGDK